jgi:peptide chain release factor 2
MHKDDIAKRITEIETAMSESDFWSDKTKAQAMIREMQELKDSLAGLGKYDKKSALITIFSGAGGDDAEDFSRILFEMYMKYAGRVGYEMKIIDETPASSGGYRSISFELRGKGVYGKLKNESGVHRLVRISPFNANSKRQTSFSMVEVIPVLDQSDMVEIKPEDLDIQFSRSGGAGGQNVNKRDTAVRITHIPTGISAHATSERSQEANRQKALEIIKGKLIRALESEHKNTIDELSISKTTDNEWGSQIRSYVLHPYQMVKDHRTDVEVRDIDKVLKNGEIEEFLEAEKEL